MIDCAIILDMVDKYPLVHPDDFSDSTAEFAQTLRDRLPTVERTDPKAEVVQSNAALGYMPPSPEHSSVQPHPTASATAIKFALHG